ncbi:hypothetical protein, partial [Umezakia ovalisporum]|uniref:hypothetical protein n=1 Tax=Umezakia ovalisporum TaxID=75695 RepID=UPI0039C6840A
MKTHLSILLFCVSLLLTTACEKAETPIVLEPTKGDVKNYTLTLGKDYTTQIFFTLSNGNTQGNDFRVWDLGFDSRPDGCFIIINGGKEVQVS